MSRRTDVTDLSHTTSQDLQLAPVAMTAPTSNGLDQPDWLSDLPEQSEFRAENATTFGPSAGRNMMALMASSTETLSESKPSVENSASHSSGSESPVGSFQRLETDESSSEHL